MTAKTNISKSYRCGRYSVGLGDAVSLEVVVYASDHVSYIGALLTLCNVHTSYYI